MIGDVSMPKPALANTRPSPPPLITEGVISAQKKMLRLLTAWEENMPMMEKATENLSFSSSECTVVREREKNTTWRVSDYYLTSEINHKRKELQKKLQVKKKCEV